MSELNIQRECTTVVKWKLSNFSTVAARNDPNKELLSDVFKIDSSGIKFCLNFEPTNIRGCDDYSSLYLVVRDFAGKSSIKLRFDLWIENELGEKIAEPITYEDVFDKFGYLDYPRWSYEYTRLGTYDFVHHNDLYSPDSQFVKNNVVFFCTRIFNGNVLPKQLIEPYRIILRDMLSEEPTKFHRNLLKSYEEGFTGECTLKVPGEEFKVSKTILTAHSDVFKAMFTHDTQEATSGIIEIEDIDANTMEAFVEYLHTESVKNISEIAFELFKTADKYGIDGLKKLCAESLVKSLDRNNLCERIILAFQHNSEDLKNGILYFIERSKNRVFISMMGSSEWIKFAAQNEKLAPEIIAAVFERLEIEN